MIEELKIIAEIMQGVTEGTTYVVLSWLVVGYLKILTGWCAAGYIAISVVRIITNACQTKNFELDPKYIEVVTKDDL